MDSSVITKLISLTVAGVTQLTQFSNEVPELADPYVTHLEDSVVVSGTAQYYLKYKSLEDIRLGGAHQVLWNDYYYADGTPMEGERKYAHSWDMKPVLWVQDANGRSRLWNRLKDKQAPLLVWYGGHMRPQKVQKTSRWPEDNYSRDVFAFTEKEPGKWFSAKDSIFAARKSWPRTQGNFLGHRYGHQIVMSPQQTPVVYYEEVTEVRTDGSPLVTKIFVDEMLTPFEAKGSPVELISPINQASGKSFPSATREDGAALVEGPLYFRFSFEGEQWEAIGFSAGSYYSRYPSCFAYRKVSEGMSGKPYQLDLTDDGSDFHDAGAELGKQLNVTGGPGRPAVIVDQDGFAIPSPDGSLQLLAHAYPNDIRPRTFRVAFYANLRIEKTAKGGLRFRMRPGFAKPVANGSAASNPGQAIQ